jgi:hypothetical protein
MAEESSTPGVDMDAVEAEIRRLPDVAAVRVVTDDLSRPVEVHVLAHTGKHAKQVVRDVQSVALASFNLEIDRRIVSVVQLAPNGGSNSASEVPRGPARVRVLGIQASTVDLRTSIRVTLEADEQATGYGEGAAAPTIRPRLVAAATLDALRQLDDAASRFDVVGAEITRLGTQDVALVTLVAVEMPLERHLAGSAIVHQSPDDAIVRAVLDAANRRLSFAPGDPHDD